MKVSWDDNIPNIWKNKKCSKPPTRDDILYIQTSVDSHTDDSHGILMYDDIVKMININLGKLWYFTNLNEGDLGMISLTNPWFQGSVATWGRDEIYPDQYCSWDVTIYSISTIYTYICIYIYIYIYMSIYTYIHTYIYITPPRLSQNSKALSTASRWVVGRAMLLVPLTHQRNILARRGDVTKKLDAVGRDVPGEIHHQSWGD